MNILISYGDDEVLELPDYVVAEQRALRMADQWIKNNSTPEDEDPDTIFYMCLHKLHPRAFVRFIEERLVII